MAKDEAYQLAEKKIEEALRSGATSLDISWQALGKKQLSEVPASLRQLKTLTRLELKFHELSELPEWLADFTQLEELRLVDNRLKELPEWLRRLTELRILAVSHNQVLSELP